MARYRLMRGRHIEKGVTYTKNKIVESDTNLLLQNSPGSLKFEKLPDRPEKAPTLDDDEDGEDSPPDLSTMTKAQIKALLEEKGIEYASDDTKDELIARFEDAAETEAGE